MRGATRLRGAWRGRRYHRGFRFATGSRKPRESGWTMVIDKGLGLNAIDDLMQVAAPVIDALMLTSGTVGILRP